MVNESSDPLTRALAAIAAVPRRSGTPDWLTGSAVAQAAGYDVGLAAASDAVRDALSETNETSEPDCHSEAQTGSDRA